MSQWTKVPKENEELLDRALEAVPESEKRKMFGCPCWFLNGNMLAGTFQEDIFLRLGEADREDLLERRLAKNFAPMNGRVMKEYVTIEKSVYQSPAEFEKLLLKARDYVLTLPPKEKKPR